MQNDLTKVNHAGRNVLFEGWLQDGMVLGEAEALAKLLVDEDSWVRRNVAAAVRVDIKAISAPVYYGLWVVGTKKDIEKLRKFAQGWWWGRKTSVQDIHPNTIKEGTEVGPVLRDKATGNALVPSSLER